MPEGVCALEAAPQPLHPCPPLCTLTRTHAHSHARRLILTARTHAATRQDDDEMEEDGDEDPSGKVPWAVLARRVPDPASRPPPWSAMKETALRCDGSRCHAGMQRVCGVILHAICARATLTVRAPRRPNRRLPKRAAAATAVRRLRPRGAAAPAQLAKSQPAQEGQ